MSRKFSVELRNCEGDLGFFDSPKYNDCVAWLLSKGYVNWDDDEKKGARICEVEVENGEWTYSYGDTENWDTNEGLKLSIDLLLKYQGIFNSATDEETKDSTMKGIRGTIANLRDNFDLELSIDFDENDKIKGYLILGD